MNEYERIHPVLYEVLRTCVRDLNPTSYLEIGVREGVSLGTVLDASGGKISRLVLCDLWGQHSGPSCQPDGGHIRTMLHDREYIGELKILSGDSHELIRGLSAPPYFDLILVDGDHTPEGVRQDSNDAWPLLREGGIMVFDDVWNPNWPGVEGVYRQFIIDHPGAWCVPELEMRDDGSGTAAVRKGPVA